MLFDTDVFIWIQKGDTQAAHLLEKENERLISAQTYLELLQCAQDRQQQNYTRQFLKDYEIRTLPLTENIGHRAIIYVEQYSLSHGLRAGDAIIAATASENNLVLCSGNRKNFKPLRDLKLKVFRPLHARG